LFVRESTTSVKVAAKKKNKKNQLAFSIFLPWILFEQTSTVIGYFTYNNQAVGLSKGQRRLKENDSRAWNKCSRCWRVRKQAPLTSKKAYLRSKMPLNTVNVKKRESHDHVVVLLFVFPINVMLNLSCIWSLTSSGWIIRFRTRTFLTSNQIDQVSSHETKVLHVILRSERCRSDSERTGF